MIKTNWIKSIPPKALFFVIKFFALFLSLEGTYRYILTNKTSIDDYIINLLISQTNAALEFLGYPLLNDSTSYLVGIEGTSGVIIGAPCDGISLFILFSSFIIVFKGKVWFKLIYCLAGIALIYLINLFRIVGLTLVVKYQPQNLEFHHSYFFTLLVYSFIFLLWLLRFRIYTKRNI